MVETVLEFAVPARFQQVGALRRATDAFLRETASDRLRDTVVLVISELCTNAIEAMHDAHAELTLRLRDLPDQLIVEVVDCGPGFSMAIVRRNANDGSERGRGLEVVRLLVDDLSVGREDGSTTVRCAIAK